MLLAILLAAVFSPAGAQDAAPGGRDDPPADAARDDSRPETEPRDPDTEALRRVRRPFNPNSGARSEGQEDPCDWDLSDNDWQEDTQEFLRGASCHTFRWFDGLFGDSVDYPEESVSGLVTLGGDWNQYEGFDGKARFRVRAPLPNLDRRWDVFFGRGDEDAYISDTETQNETFYNPGLVNRNEEDSLLLGLGHRRRDGRKGWDLGGGVRLRTPPVPYVRAQWYYYKAYSPQTDLRFRQTFFWRSDDGFGATARADLAHAFNPEDVLRWETVITKNEETRGTDWYVGQTWYHLMRDQHAFSLLAFAYGETDGPVGVRDIGFNFIWRRPFTRDYLWLSFGPSATWPRFEREDKRELSLGFGVWVEMEFGEWRY